MAGRHVGTRAVIVGAEHVSFSAILTLAHVDCRAVAMVTALPRHQSYGALRLAAATIRRVPVITGAGIAEIVGRRRVEQVVLTNGRRLDCDTVVFTGDWIPDNELARRSGLEMEPTLKGPVVDDAFRTSRENVFAIGNLVHKVAAADRCALDGKAVASEIVAALASDNTN
jgi:NAD(P)H-nitrite reductase large subunit